MITPGQSISVSETVYIEGKPDTPDSITAVLYRVVAGVRTASGVSVTVAVTANLGEYTFSWVNDAGWARTDDLELRVIPVIGGVSYPAVIWRSHGAVPTTDQPEIISAIGNVPGGGSSSGATIDEIKGLFNLVFLSTTPQNIIDYGISFNVNTKQIKIFQSDTYSEALNREVVITFNDLPISLTGIPITFTARKFNTTPVLASVSTVSSDTISLEFDAENTDRPTGDYFYQIKTDNGVTLLTGTLKIVDRL